MRNNINKRYRTLTKKKTNNSYVVGNEKISLQPHVSNTTIINARLIFNEYNLRGRIGDSPERTCCSSPIIFIHNTAISSTRNASNLKPDINFIFFKPIPTVTYVQFQIEKKIQPGLVQTYRDIFNKISFIYLNFKMDTFFTYTTITIFFFITSNTL